MKVVAMVLVVIVIVSVYVLVDWARIESAQRNLRTHHPRAHIAGLVWPPLEFGFANLHRFECRTIVKPVPHL